MIDKINSVLLKNHLPSVYEGETLTTLEYVAKMTGKMNELVDVWNAFEKDIKISFEEFENGTIESVEALKLRMEQQYQDFIRAIDLAVTKNRNEIDTQNTTLSNAMERMNLELDNMWESINTQLEEYANAYMNNISSKVYGNLRVDPESEMIIYEAHVDSDYTVTVDSNGELIDIQSNM